MIDPMSIYLPLVLLLVLGLATAYTARVARSQGTEIRILLSALEAQSHRIDTLERDLGAVLSCSRQIGSRISDQDRSRETLQKQIDRLRLQAHGEDAGASVEHAMKLLNAGHALDEVVEVCELSAGEAEILQSLERFRTAA